MSVFVGADNFEKRTLPSGYTQLEYIQSSGTQYIDTGFKPTSNNIRVVIDFSYVSTATGQSIFGAQTAGGSPYGIVPYMASVGTPKLYCGTSSQILSTSISENARNEWDITAINGTATWNVGGNTMTASYSGTPCQTSSYYIFANNNGGSVLQQCSAKLYSCRIYNNGTLARDFVPAKNSSGTIGLYDLVNSKFYTNAGSGTFTAGKVYVSGNIAREVDAIDLGINAVAREVDAGYLGVSAIARQVWGGGTPLSDLSVGETVYMNVNGVSKEFIVVNQGLPSSLYDSSCDGTWLLMKDCYESRSWHSSNSNDYENSTIHSYLNNTFANLFDSDIKNVIKQVKIPYRKGAGTSSTVTSGANGLTTKVFLLSNTEAGLSGATIEGTALDYFDGANNSMRIGYLNGTAVWWWLRSPYIGTNISVGAPLGVNPQGTSYYYAATTPQGVRPALILPSDTLVDVNYNVIA